MVGMGLEDSEKYKSHSCHLWKSWCRSNLEEVKIFLVERSKEWIFFAKIGNLKNLGQSIFGLGRQKFVVLCLSLSYFLSFSLSSLPLSPSNSLYSKGSHLPSLSGTLAHCFHLFLALVCQSLSLSNTLFLSHSPFLCNVCVCMGLCVCMLGSRHTHMAVHIHTFILFLKLEWSLSK